MTGMTERSTLKRYAYLSIAAALATIGLKAAAYFLTGSVGLLSDALESVVNLVAASVALVSLVIAARPPDTTHEYGHDKIEYFSSGIEGTLILVAAAGIVVASVQRLLAPEPLQQVGIGLILSIAASVINFVVARVLYRVGINRESITLQADAQHLMGDVWTSVGVVAGVIVVSLSGIYWLDPLIGILVAIYILYTGVRLVMRSFRGLMDTPISADERSTVEAILNGYRLNGVDFHALRTRQAGARRFISVHVLVKDTWTVKRGHDLVEALEGDLRRAIPNASILTHLEPLGDPVAMEDVSLDRGGE
jgi:cation diffusion facilitator family transporter